MGEIWKGFKSVWNFKWAKGIPKEDLGEFLGVTLLVLILVTGLGLIIVALK